jgi:hypothetical protein
MIVYLRPVYAAFAVAAMSAILPVTAQDVAPDTPSELRVFKLDPENAPPVRGPLPTTDVVVKPAEKPAVTAAPVIEAAPVRIPAPKPAAAKQVTIKPVAVKPVAARPIVGTAATVASETAPVEALSDRRPELAPDGPLPNVAPPIAASETKPPIADMPWQWILAAIMLAMGAAIAFLLRRRRNIARGAQAMAKPVLEVEDRHKIAAAPAAPVAAPITARRPVLQLSFTPENARITLANLSIKGRLHIINTGTDAATAMHLNAAVISASTAQNEAIARYFAGSMPPGKELGSAKSGESIALEMDLTIPIADLQTFAAGDMQLLVPIMLARLSYQWGGAEGQGGRQQDEAQLSCLIGRESTPPKTKMGALRLDLGPRNFASLGQRPVFG